VQFNAPGVNEDEIQAASERLLNLAAPYTKGTYGEWRRSYMAKMPAYRCLSMFVEIPKPSIPHLTLSQTVDTLLAWTDERTLEFGLTVME